MNRLGDSGVHILGDTSAFVNPAGQLLLIRRVKIRMYTVGIVFNEFLSSPSLMYYGNLFQLSGALTQLEPCDINFVENEVCQRIQ